MVSWKRGVKPLSAGKMESEPRLVPSNETERLIDGVR